MSAIKVKFTILVGIYKDLTAIFDSTSVVASKHKGLLCDDSIQIGRFVKIKIS